MTSSPENRIDFDAQYQNISSRQTCPLDQNLAYRLFAPALEAFAWKAPVVAVPSGANLTV
jgi:hypothetical protein